MPPQEGEGEQEYWQRCGAALEAQRQKVFQHKWLAIHGVVQALLAAGLLQVRCPARRRLGARQKPCRLWPNYAPWACRGPAMLPPTTARRHAAPASPLICLRHSPAVHHPTRPLLPSTQPPAPMHAQPCHNPQVAPFKPRTVGFLGVVASAMNCYFLMFPGKLLPPLSAPPPPPALAVAGLPPRSPAVPQQEGAKSKDV